MIEPDKAMTSPYRHLIDPFLLCRDGKKIPYGFGCAWLVNWRQPDWEKAAVTLKAAWEAGFRYFDTAPSYCKGMSEEALGSFVPTVPRGEIFLASKVEGSALQDGANGVLRSLERSLGLLQTDCLDLYQIHNLDSSSFERLQRQGVFDCLLRLKEEGTVGRLGLASEHPFQDAVDCGLFDTILFNSRLTPIDMSASFLAERAACRGMGIINASPLSGGMFGGDPAVARIYDSELHHRRQEMAVDLYTRCLEWGVPLLELALQYPLRNPLIDITLTGPRSAEMIQDTLAALQAPVADDIWPRLEAWMAGRAGRWGMLR